jgi:tRNA nucleotidyltransferase (CCA-adding enzyme)
LFGVRFDLPELVDDIAYPQLERAHKGMSVALQRCGFSALRGDIYFDSGEALLLFEMNVWQLPAVERRLGPPVSAKRHAAKFKKKYVNEPSVLTGPYIDSGRYVVELRRKYLTLPEFLCAEFRNFRSSKAVVQAMEKEFQILKDEEILQTDGIRRFLASYLSRTLNNCD